VDFSANGRWLQSNSDNGELRFWDVLAADLCDSPFNRSDTVWATRNCTLGWAVKGVWPVSSLTSMAPARLTPNSLDLSRDQKTLICGDNDGSIRMLSFPCPHHGAADEAYHFHSRIRFLLCCHFVPNSVLLYWYFVLVFLTGTDISS
jgi:microtubule-associated protein-like 1/2